MQVQKPADAARIIKTRRLELGLTQQDLAQAAGITRQSLARIEKGGGGGAFETYLRVFELLNVNLETQLDSTASSTARSTARVVAFELPSRESLNKFNRTSSNAARTQSRTLSNQSFDDFRKQLDSLRHTFASDTGRPSRTTVGLAHLKSVIDSSAPEHAAPEHDAKTQTKSSQEG